jgi:MoaA/NifB/PqqE/SkfB family radical SAM enzyme
MLRYDLVLETLQYAQQKGVTVGMVTNGSLLDERRLADLAEAGLHRIAFSLDGSTPEVHDRIRVPGSYSKVLDSLDLCDRTRKAQGSDFRVHVNTVVMGPNVEQLTEIAAIAKRYEAAYLVQPVDVPQVVDQTHSDPSASASVQTLMVAASQIPVLQQQILRLLDMQRKDGVVANLTWQLQNTVRYYRQLAGLETPPRFRCYVGFNSVHFDSDGKFGSCIFMPPVGDLYKVTLREAWQGDSYADHRKAIRVCQRPCALNCYYPMSLGMLAYNFAYLPARRSVVRALWSVLA